jgi:hypothetical protein
MANNPFCAGFVSGCADSHSVASVFTFANLLLFPRTAIFQAFSGAHVDSSIASTVGIVFAIHAIAVVRKSDPPLPGGP